MFFKGRRVRAFSVWASIKANKLTIKEAAEDRDLPVAAVREAIKWTMLNLERIQAESDLFRAKMSEHGKIGA